MRERLEFIKELLKEILNVLLTVYLAYLFFLYLWSTFDYLIPKLDFVLALLITAATLGFWFWQNPPKVLRKK